MAKLKIEGFEAVAGSRGAVLKFTDEVHAALRLASTALGQLDEAVTALPEPMAEAVREAVAARSSPRVEALEARLTTALELLRECEDEVPVRLGCQVDAFVSDSTPVVKPRFYPGELVTFFERVKVAMGWEGDDSAMLAQEVEQLRGQLDGAEMLALLREWRDYAHGDAQAGSGKWTSIDDRVAALLAKREMSCPGCGHALGRHDPEDGTCDAHADEGLGVCPCGREVPHG